MPLMNKLFTMMSQTCLKSEKSNFKSFWKKNEIPFRSINGQVHRHTLCVCVCVCVCVSVCVCEQTKGDVLAGSFQTQASSTIFQLMIFSSKNEFGSQKQDTQAQTRRHTKQETPVLVYLGMKFHCCCTLHLAAQSIWEKGGQNETFEDWSKKHQEQPKFPCWSCVLELELMEHSSVHSIHLNCILQPVHTDTDKAVTMLLLFCPWRHQLCQMVISVPLWHVSTRRHPSVYQAFCNGGFVVHKHTTKCMSSAMRW